ncbi:hypothetical protein ACI093_004101 [Cronobacter turicensis]
MKKIFVFILITFFPFTVWSSKYPVVTSINPVLVNNDGYKYNYQYYITQAIIDVGPSADVVPSKNYNIALGHRHDPTSVAGSGGISATLHDPVDGKKTMSELALGLYESRGKTTTHVDHSGNRISPYECVGYFAYVQINDPWSSVILPGGCLNVPPVEQWCKITSPEILLDHGTITLNDAEGSTAQKNIGVECVGDMAVSFKLVSDDSYIYLDDGKSEITVDDKPLGSKIDLPGGASTVTIKDMLTGVKTEGVHSGSSVLMMMPY